MQPASFPKSTRTWMANVLVRSNRLEAPTNLLNFTLVSRSWRKLIDEIRTKKPRHLLWSLTRRLLSFRMRNVSKKSLCASVTKRAMENSWTCICYLISTSIWRTSRFVILVIANHYRFCCRRLITSVSWRPLISSMKSLTIRPRKQALTRNTSMVFWTTLLTSSSEPSRWSMLSMLQRERTM